MRVDPSKNAVRRRMDFAIAPKPVAARESAGSTPSSLPGEELACCCLLHDGQRSMASLGLGSGRQAAMECRRVQQC